MSEDVKMKDNFNCSDHKNEWEDHESDEQDAKQQNYSPANFLLAGL